MERWKWLEDGRSVEIETGGMSITFTGATVKDFEWQAFYAKIADEAEAYTVLKRAKRSFEAGLADYVNARENVKSLIRELNGSISILLKLCADVDAFFSPPEVAQLFRSDPQGLIEFVMDFTARTYTRSISGGD